MVYVHGYNVNDQEARGEFSEVFKRLYWSGSKARFWGITWYGWETQKPTLPCVGKRSPNYHVNVRHAYDGGIYLKTFADSKGLKKATFIAHSLGNMLVSTAIQKNMDYDRYFMMNAAVADEAYTPEEKFSNEGGAPWYLNTNPLMYYPLWRYPGSVDVPMTEGYQPFLWASEWYKLFKGTTDDRQKLTWRNFFGKVRDDAKTYVFYSETDEAFVPFPNDPLLSDDVQPKVNINNVPGSDKLQIDCTDVAKIGTYSWSFQEMLKGRLDGTQALVVADSKYGGWGFNKDDGYVISCTEPVAIGADPPPYCGFIPPANANALAGNILKTMPLFFKNPDNSALFTDGPASLSEAKIVELLANEIPALTYAVGHNGMSVFKDKGRNFDLRQKYINTAATLPWPITKIKKGVFEWRHSDFRNVAYPYLYRMFDDWAKLIRGNPLP